MALLPTLPPPSPTARQTRKSWVPLLLVALVGAAAGYGGVRLGASLHLGRAESAGIGWS